MSRPVLEFTGWHGADVILDIMGASYLARNLSALATWGRLVGIATPSVTAPRLTWGC